jgi:hypothetical protein
MLTTTTSYRLIARDMTRSLAQKAAEKPVALETANYMKQIGEIKSIDEFLKNTRVFKFAMTAFGLEDMAHAKGLMRKILTEGVADAKSLANRMNDDRFKEFATVFNFARDGEATTTTTAAKQGVVDRYVRQTLEVSAGEENEGVRLALYFQRMAPQVTTTYGLLGDAALTEVVKTVLGLPDEMANADIEKQAAAIEKRLDIEDLADPVKLERFINRFVTTYDALNVTATSPVLSLFDDSYSSGTLTLDLAMTLNNLKRGGF